MAKFERKPEDEQDPKRPMAVSEPSQIERIEALELQNALMKKALNYIYQQHYRKDAV